MMRLVIVFLVLFSSSFVGGSNHLSTNELPNAFLHSSFKPVATPELNSLHSSNKQIFQDAGTSGAEDDTLNATEIEEEDEVESSRKHIETSDYAFSYFYNQVPGNIHLYLKDRLPAGKHFSYIFSERHILHRVIRV